MEAYRRFIYFFLLLPNSLLAAGWQLTVSAGGQDRSNCLVRFPAPPEMHGFMILKAEGQDPLPLQLDSNGSAVFVLPRLARGMEATFEFLSVDRGKDFQVTEASGLWTVAAPEGGLLASYQMQAGPVPDGVSRAFMHGAHFHPLYSPSGRIVTGNHSEDHRWHRGVWMAWTDTEFEGRHPDFWNMGKEKTGVLTGEVRFDKLTKSDAGPVGASFESQHRFIDHTSGAEKDVLVETWLAFISQIGKGNTAANVIDLTSIQRCAGNEPLKLPKYHYGGLGVRGNPAWNPVKEVEMLTSNGDDRTSGDGTKAKWVHLGGKVDGESTGLVVLIHPDNFRFPQPLRLNPKNPQLCIAPSAGGDWEIRPGEAFTSRYRLVIQDGVANKGNLERLWEDYAHPPTVQVTKVP